MDLLLDSRYKDTPVYIFFENYVLDIIGALAPEKQDILQGLELQKIFGTQAQAWKDVVREALHLSSTIDIAILYQWYKTVDANTALDTQIDPAQFSKEFVDNYFHENSQIDVWDEESLTKAKALIRRHQLSENTVVD